MGETRVQAPLVAQQSVNCCGLDRPQLRQHHIGRAVVALFQRVGELIEQFFRPSRGLPRGGGNSHRHLLPLLFSSHQKGQQTTGKCVGLAGAWAAGEHVE